ncbi:MAG: bifunctional nicotinamidase/pyrazinamidase [Rhodobacteraceae bacterium]|nr:bifunctional nicotinamidase/pyrazinamidase [Paracoccaceae bacterium]
MPRSDTALIMIDIQNDFCPGGALAVDGGSDIIARINQLQADYAVQVLTQDWHPKDHSSFAENQNGAEAFTMIDMPYGPQVLWPVHCVQGSHGADFHSNLRTDSADMILRKGFRSAIDSYSAFFENDHKTRTGLEGYLRERGVHDLVMVGLATDFCVRYSAVDAAKLGFHVTVLEGACRAIDLDGSLVAARKDMLDHGIRLVD